MIGYLRLINTRAIGVSIIMANIVSPSQWHIKYTLDIATKIVINNAISQFTPYTWCKNIENNTACTVSPLGIEKLLSFFRKCWNFLTCPLNVGLYLNLNIFTF